MYRFSKKLLRSVSMQLITVVNCFPKFRRVLSLILMKLGLFNFIKLAYLRLLYPGFQPNAAHKEIITLSPYANKIHYHLVRARQTLPKEK